MADDYGVISQFYDADYAALNYAADTPFYVETAKESGGPVLEMGCGTGRVLLPIARAGIRIHGVDLSPGMLGQLRKKLAAEPAEVRERITIAEGDMRTCDAGSRFPLVTSPFRAVQMLIDRADQRAWLRNVRRHLAPGGALVFDVFQPNFEFLVGEHEPYIDVDRTDEATGKRIRRIITLAPKNALQTARCDMRWVIGEGEDAVDTTNSFTLRWFTRGELESLLELEGFQITDYWGTFQRDPFGENSPEQVIRAVVRE